MRAVFVNPERCIGCLQCEFACAVAHSTSKDESRAFLERPTPRSRVRVEPGVVPTTSYPSLCRHCDPAPCERVCPTGAISRDEGGEWVLVDPSRCIGCAMCAVVCPFDVITFDPVVGGPDETTPVAVKCDACVARLAEGREPACAEVCKVDALVFGDVNELVAAGRLREGVAALAATATRTDTSATDALAAWRAWGTARLAAREALDGERHPASSNGKKEPARETP